MFSANEIRNVKFNKGMGGYKAEEVNALMKKIAGDYEEYESRMKKFQSKVDEMKKELDELKGEKASINSVLLSAQRMAEKTIADANAKRNEILADGERIRKENEQTKAELDQEMADFRTEHEKEKTAMLAAAAAAVEQQQASFDKIRIEIRDFRMSVLEQLKAEMASVESFPDAAMVDAQAAAKAAQVIVSQPLDVEAVAKEAVAPKDAPQPAKESSEKKSEGKKEENKAEEKAEKKEDNQASSGEAKNGGGKFFRK